MPWGPSPQPQNATSSLAFTDASMQQAHRRTRGCDAQRLSDACMQSRVDPRGPRQRMLRAAGGRCVAQRLEQPCERAGVEVRQVDRYHQQRLADGMVERGRDAADRPDAGHCIGDTPMFRTIATHEHARRPCTLKQVDGTIEQYMEAGLFFVGTPDEVYEQLVTFHDETGGFGNLLMMAQAGELDHQETAENLTLMGREVAPRLAELATRTVEVRYEAVG